MLAVEVTSDAMLGLLDPGATADLLLSGSRAAALGLGNIRESADPARPVRIVRAAWLGQAEALALADPARDLDRAPMGPLSPTAPPDEADAALTLARRAGLLPALWLLEVGNLLLSAQRRKRITADKRRELAAAASALRIRVDREPVAITALDELAARYSLSAYDAAYLELALHRGLPLATLDAALLAAMTKASVPAAASAA